MRTASILAASWLLCACSGGEEPPIDAPPPDAGRAVCKPPPNLCGSAEFRSLCGNGQIDWCWAAPMPGHCYYQPFAPEPCDGAAGLPTCQSLGYASGETKCVGCSVDKSGCMN